MLNQLNVDAIVAFEQGDYQNALVLFLQAITFEHPPESYLYIGKCFFFGEEKSKAIPYVVKYIELEQDTTANVAALANAYDLLAQCYEATQQLGEALRFYQKATDLDPTCASAWHNRGLFTIKSAQSFLKSNFEQSKKLWADAQNFLKKALKVCSTNPMFLQSLASWFEQYIEVLEELKEHQSQIGECFEQAIGYYQQALAVCLPEDEPLQTIIRENLTECIAQYGHHFYRHANYVRAQTEYLQVLQFDTNHLPALTQLGMSYFRQKSYAKAREYFLSILDKTQENQERADAWLNVACTYRKEKKWLEAEKALKQARQFAPNDEAIDKEEIKLTTAKMNALLINAPQILFKEGKPTASTETKVNHTSPLPPG